MAGECYNVTILKFANIRHLITLCTLHTLNNFYVSTYKRFMPSSSTLVSSTTVLSIPVSSTVISSTEHFYFYLLLKIMCNLMYYEPYHVEMLSRRNNSRQNGSRRNRSRRSRTRMLPYKLVCLYSHNYYIVLLHIFMAPYQVEN